MHCVCINSWSVDVDIPSSPYVPYMYLHVDWMCQKVCKFLTCSAIGSQFFMTNTTEWKLTVCFGNKSELLASICCSGEIHVTKLRSGMTKIETLATARKEMLFYEVETKVIHMYMGM